MITTTIQINGRSGKQKEIAQTIKGLTEQVTDYTGCLRAELYQDLDDQNIFYLIEEWSSREALERYKASRLMAVLLGLETLLTESLLIRHAVRLEVLQERKRTPSL